MTIVDGNDGQLALVIENEKLVLTQSGPDEWSGKHKSQPTMITKMCDCELNVLLKGVTRLVRRVV